MNLKSILLPLLLVVAAAGFAHGADAYKIDTAHSYVGFGIKHMVIATVKGKFTEFEGLIHYDEADITKSSVEVKIKAASINTANEARDNHLRNPDFFDVAKYPEITFKSSRVEKKGDKLQVAGTLTMHGVSKEVVIPFDFNGKVKDPWGNERVGFAGSLTLDRTDYGLTWGKLLETGGLVVDNIVKIELEIEAVKSAK